VVTAFDPSKRRYPAVLTLFLILGLTMISFTHVIPRLGGYTFYAAWCDNDKTQPNHKPVNVVQGTVLVTVLQWKESRLFVTDHCA
jgi:hypothetical protein